MTRRITHKDGAEAVAMLDRERTARKRAPRLHLDPATGATVLEPKRPAAKKPDDEVHADASARVSCPACHADAGTPCTFAKGTTGKAHAARLQLAEATRVQPRNRAPAPAPQPAAKAPKSTSKQAPKVSKASLVRALLDDGKTVRECADALKDRGITWSYCWDVAAAYEKKTGKVFIASHAKDGAK